MRLRFAFLVAAAEDAAEDAAAFFVSPDSESWEEAAP